MDKKRVLLLIRIVLLVAFMIVTAYLYLNRRKEPDRNVADNSNIIRRIVTEGLTVEGASGLVECISVSCYGPDSDITRQALKKADIKSGVLSAVYYEMIYVPGEKDAAVQGDFKLMCSASLKNEMASEDGELHIYRLEDKKASIQQMFIKEKDPAWISDGIGNYLLVRLYPEELLVAEEKTEETETAVEPETETVAEPTPEPTAEPTPTPKPTATPTPKAQEAAATSGFYSTAELNVRQAPNRESKVLGVVEAGERLEGVEATEDSKWYKVTYNGETGYVSSQYVIKKD